LPGQGRYRVVAADDARERSGEIVAWPGFPGRRRRQRLPLKHYRRNKAVAPSRDIGQIAIAPTAIAQDFADGGDVDPQVSLLDERVGPDAGNDFFLGDNFACPLDQRGQDFERPAAEMERPLAFEQKLP
jgi:hypothetical protein